MDELYSFIYRGVLTETGLDRIGRNRVRNLTGEESVALGRSLSCEMLDQELLAEAQHMSLVYVAVHTFENMVRKLVIKSMAEAHGEDWWDKAPEKIRKKVTARMDEDAKFRWHGARGATEITYCDFGDLSSIIVTNWPVFEDLLSNLEWTKQILGTLEKSRNILMHSGVLGNEDIERIGMNIRDWVRQTG